MSQRKMYAPIGQLDTACLVWRQRSLEQFPFADHSRGWPCSLL